jgi:hypothetical protein
VNASVIISAIDVRCCFFNCEQNAGGGRTARNSFGREKSRHKTAGLVCVGQTVWRLILFVSLGYAPSLFRFRANAHPNNPAIITIKTQK